MLPRLAKLATILGPKYAEAWTTAAELPVELEVRLLECPAYGQLQPHTIEPPCAKYVTALHDSMRLRLSCPSSSR